MSDTEILRNRIITELLAMEDDKFLNKIYKILENIPKKIKFSSYHFGITGKIQIISFLTLQYQIE